MNSQLTKTIKYSNVKNNQINLEVGDAAIEKPVTLSLNGIDWLTFLCTPSDLEALATGFLYNESIIQAISEIESIHVCESGDIIEIWLNHSVEKPTILRRTSGCSGGVTQANVDNYPTISFSCKWISSEKLNNLTSLLYHSQSLYKISGGVHVTALSDGENLIIVSEDIGRHNSMDKLVGRYLLENIILNHKIILTTGRISSEMLQKAARFGAEAVISRTAATSLSIELAQQLGITLITYARHNQFKIITYPDRISFQP
jgi:FdhD protein